MSDLYSCHKISQTFTIVVMFDGLIFPSFFLHDIKGHWQKKGKEIASFDAKNNKC